MREHFTLFRTCYEQGLARSATLRGTVTLRFVIDRNGSVSHVSSTGQTTMPDARVVGCMLEAASGMRFPPPEGGIVTVVYPISLAPE